MPQLEALQALTIRQAFTQEDREHALEVRRSVFIQEQKIPESIEIDEHENDCIHFLVLLGQEAVGAGRLRLKGQLVKFERIATLKSHRKLGVGRKLMEAMQEYARIHFPEHQLAMHAQRSAIGFYEKLGWQAVGEEFLEAGIPHRLLVLQRN